MNAARDPDWHRKLEPPPLAPCKSDLNVLATIKGDERYVFIFADSQRMEALRTLGRFASNPELSFGWEDACELGAQLWESQQKAARALTEVNQ